jgi:CRP-like cAMP-binding protein
MHDQLFAHIRKYTSLQSHEEKWLRENLEYRDVKNKSFLFEAGQICTANYFVIKGCLRMYLHTQQGSEQIIQFGIDNWWITDHISLNLQQPSRHYLQAVEHSAILVFKHAVQEEAFQKVPQLERYFRIIYERAYAASLTRIHYILNLSGEERYIQFTTSFPDFVQRVPQYMLASFLGFTPEFLSKVRGKKP